MSETFASESPRGALRSSAFRRTAPLCALACSACSFSGGIVDAYDFPIKKAADSVRSNHVGLQGASYLHLPREYRYVLGVQGAVLGQTGPKTMRDQWRLGAAFGYTAFPGFDGSPVGFEAMLTAGMLRGDVGEVQGPLGFYYGIRAGLPLRIDSSQASWQRDGELQARFFLVPELGVQPVHALQNNAPNRVFIEPFIAINLRLQLNSGLVP